MSSTTTSPTTLRLILGDQLNHQHSWFQDTNDKVIYVLMEVRQETDYVKHHIQKVAAFFAAMSHFSEWLQERGHRVHYFKLDDNDNKQDIPGNIQRLIDRHSIQRFEYQQPDEYRLDEQLSEFCNQLDIETACVSSEHFFTDRLDVKDFFGEKDYLMERFYREMRKQHKVLMDSDKPEGGKWNYDQQNRKKLPKTHTPVSAYTPHENVSDIVEMIRMNGVDTFGEIDPKKLLWPVTREKALKLLRRFIDELLPEFGTYQDAMHTNDWMVYHSRLSFAMNAKLLSPKEVVEKAEAAYREDPKKYPLNAVEGFIRQILGWREYMRGVYWAKMPAYANENFFEHQRDLPDWYWTGETKMNCLRHAIGQSLEHAYAHHIQRLMVTGNFALLAGCHPDAVDAWYLGIYIDAIEWVELPNTRGMSQFADGGLVATKPYVSSANYIDKMSNYCKGCHYLKSKKTGEGACPFNSLYWHFIGAHYGHFTDNPRMNMMLSLWDKKSEDDKNALLDQAEAYLGDLNRL